MKMWWMFVGIVSGETIEPILKKLLSVLEEESFLMYNIFVILCHLAVIYMI